MSIYEILKQNAENNNKVVDKITYTIKPSFTTRKLKQLQKENNELKELIDTILNWNIFKNECPMNFGYDEETNEGKAQDVFYKDDDYCENNCNDDYTKCWLKYFKRMHELEKGDSNE